MNSSAQKRAGSVAHAQAASRAAVVFSRAAPGVAPLAGSCPEQALLGQVPRSRLVGNGSIVADKRKHGRSAHLNMHETQKASALVVEGRFSLNLLSPRRQERDNKGRALGFDLALGIVTRRAKTTGFLVGLVSVANRARPEGNAQRI